jgi:hypothetical protein
MSFYTHSQVGCTLFAQRRFEVISLTIYQRELINSGRIVPIYLDEVRSGSIGIGLI